MTMDTVTLGHFQVPVVTADSVAEVKSAGKAALSSTKAFGKYSWHFSVNLVRRWSCFYSLTVYFIQILMEILIPIFADVTKSMANVKMSSDTSYKQQFETKKLVKLDKFSYQDG